MISFDRRASLKTTRFNPEALPFALADSTHTDSLELLHGPIRPEVLVHDNQLRVAHLVDAGGISRTTAVTLFPRGGLTGVLTDINQAIINGNAPIGSAFKSFGYSTRRNILAVEIVDLPDWLKTAFKVDQPQAKVRYSEILARAGNGPVHLYGTVCEIYHPEFVPAVIREQDLLPRAPTVGSLLPQRVTLPEIWDRTGWGIAVDRTDSRYNQAVTQSTREIFLIKASIKATLRQLADNNR